MIEVPVSKEKEYRKALKKKGLPKYVNIIGKSAGLVEFFGLWEGL